SGGGGIGSEAFGGWYEPASGPGTGSAGNDGCGDASSVDGVGDTEGADGGDVVGGCCSWVGSGDCCATGAPLTPPAVNATAMAVAKATRSEERRVGEGGRAGGGSGHAAKPVEVEPSAGDDAAQPPAG